MHSHTIKVLTRLLLVNCRGILVRVPMLSPLAGSWSGLDRNVFILGETVCNNSLHLGGDTEGSGNIFLDFGVQTGVLTFPGVLYASKQHKHAIIA